MTNPDIAPSSDIVVNQSTSASVRWRRLESVDILRGLVIVLMALDHVRDFFTNVRFDPLDLERTWAALYFTRWITHFCAPVFVLLAGTGAYLSAARGRSKRELSRLLLTRGLWLVFLELTVVRFGWTFNLDYSFSFLQVIWAIGVSMVVMSALIYLPTRSIAAIGLGIIAVHNLLDPLIPGQFGPFAQLWMILHEGGPIPLSQTAMVFIAYPVLPWIGVMAAGWALGALMREPDERRRRTLWVLGATLTAGFVVLRASHIYGDANAWIAQRDGALALLDFLDTTKYPPSVLFLMMTLGPSLLLLAWLDGRSIPALRPMLIFGRVPLFFYMIHLIAIHAFAVLALKITGKPYRWLFENPPSGLFAPPADTGWGLPVVYAAWLTVILVLYLPCRWFSELKAHRKDAWLSYL